MTTNATTPEAEITQDQLDKIIERARKILAVGKSGSSGSEEEMDTAMRRVQELMAKYNLDMATIEAASTSKSAADSTERIEDKFVGKTRFLWQRQVAQYVAEAHFCYHLIGSIRVGGFWARRGSDQPIPDGEPRKESDRYHDRKRVKQHIFVGRKGNVTTAIMMYHYITQRVEDLTPIKDNKDRLSNFAMSFKAGCADRVCARLAKRRQDLIDRHDAKVKAEQEAFAAEVERKRAERAARKELPAHKPLEIKAAFAGATAGAINAKRPFPAQAEDAEHPEIDPNGPWTPEGEAVEDDEDGTPKPTSLVLMSMYTEQESDANIEFHRGLAPGTLARRRAEELEWERQWEEREAARLAAEELAAIEKPVVEETARERKAREAREAREWEKDRRRWAREGRAAERAAAREYNKYDRAAYEAGQKVGNKIGLDTQVTSRSGAPKALKGR